MKTVTVTELRGSINTLLEEVLATGIPLEINKGGVSYALSPLSRLINLPTWSSAQM